MKKLILPLVVWCALVACNNQQQKSDVTLTYQNPIIETYSADPYVLYDNGYYYLITSHKAEDGDFLPLYKSKNLSEWEFVRGAVTQGDTTDWNFKNFWAPEIIKIEDVYYLYYTASPKDSPRNQYNRVGLATAKNIEGPYTDHGVVIQHGSIDGHPFIDKDGQMYMYFTVEQLNSKGLQQGQIYVHKMKDPYTTDGEPIRLMDHFGWQEGAFIVPHNDEYWMTYSVGAWKNNTYHIRLAKAPSPTGPFSLIEKPLMVSNDIVYGPGHNSVFYDHKKNPWLVYHAWDTAYTSRTTRLDPLYWENDTLKANEPTTQPTTIN
ncbi:glycoside hydrolase family 43 protein [Reichenbachiella carrageenanivorans]|uniref:Glycoside hydrolase family 43 protein n=1 Tax=Reichenbachiella carrageenanivorans TaxID=2979869 RepID=A0ABY6D4D2_9BACT|nr:glycoside hydrolase family 43 protein [Reichenbachiella carrageenanivorans]UXX81016.1 glycoside hydrolase family 43 protein [Reichenbachiella carrageenanivorans]